MSSNSSPIRLGEYMSVSVPDLVYIQNTTDEEEFVFSVLEAEV